VSGGSIKFGVWKYEEPSLSLEITRDDLYYDEGIPPVDITKRDPKDTYNQILVKWTDFSKESGHSFVVAKDAVDQRITGTIRERTYNLLGIHSSELATKTAYRLLAESLYRYDMYKFTLSYRTMVIEVGDVRYLSDGFGLDKQPILITRINEDTNSGRMVIEAVENKEFLYLSFDDNYEFDQNYSENQHERQEPIDADDLVEPNLYFTESQQDSFINIHICPQDEDFNGFVLHYSFDDETYNYLGDCTIDNLSCNVDGVILSNLISYPVVMRRPKDAFELEENVSFISLQSASDLQFFNKQSLLKIENEILAFKDVTEVGANFMVSNLIRGLFNTKPVEHVSGVSWHSLKIDYKFKFNMEDVGKTIYFKALTHYGDKMIQLEDATPTPYVISGQYMKPLPVSLMRINGREGLSTYKTNDVVLDWYFCSKSSGFGRGGYGNAPWGNYTKDSLLERLKVELESVAITERKDYYYAGEDSYATFYGDQWRGQTFTPQSSYKIGAVRLKLYRVGSPGTITVSIKATDVDGKPSGDDLCSGTFNGNLLTEDSGGEWYVTNLNNRYSLVDGTKYAIVVRLEGNASNYLGLRKASSSPTYEFGQYAYSNDGGVAWTLLDHDMMFGCYFIQDEELLIDENFELDDYGEPVQLEILETDRNGKNPIKVKITPGSSLWSDETRDILIEKT